jgi:hypothetical protein
MRSAQSLRSSNRHDQNEVWAPDLNDAGEPLADDRLEIAAERSRYDGRTRWQNSNGSYRSSGIEDNQFASKGPSIGGPGIGKRMLRAIFRVCVAILIGVVGTLSWQSYGDEAKETVRILAPSLDWLIPPATPRSPTADEHLAELAGQLKPMALDLAVIRKGVEQLAANQEQLAARDGAIAQNIAALQSIAQELADKISSLPAPKTAHISPRRAPEHLAQPSNVQ